MWRRIFSDDNNIRKQSRSYCFNQEFSVSRTNKAHWYSNSLHQRKNDRRFHRFNLRIHRSNDNWRSDTIINQRQICSISRRFKNRISTFSTKTFRDSNLWKFIKCLVATICENLSTSLLFRDNNRQSSVKSNIESIFQWELNQVRI